MTLRFLRELRALRGETSFFIKCKEFTIKTLNSAGHKKSPKFFFRKRLVSHKFDHYIKELNEYQITTN